MSVNIKMDLKNPVQANFLGNNAVYHGYAGMPDVDGRVYTEEQCEIEADRVAELGLRVARTFYKWWPWDSETNTWNWDNEIMKPFYKWLQRMKERNIQVSLNTGWCMPGDVNEVGGFNGKSPFKVEGDWIASTKKYAEWVSESLYQIVELRGFTNVTYIELFTEPQYGIKFNYLIDNKHAYELWADCAKAVTEQLIADGRRNLVKIIGPNEGSTSTSIMNKWVAENAAEYVDIFSSHNYQDFITEEEPKPDFDNAIMMTIAGAKIQQVVPIKPNTTYKLTFKIKLQIADRMTTSGCIIFGAWDADRLNDNEMIESGGQATNRLNLKSVKLIDHTELPDGIQEISMSFNSEDKSKCAIGIFRDIKEKESVLKLLSASLVEEGGSENILVNADFTQITAGKLFGPNDQTRFIGQAWRQGSCSKERSGDPYWHLRGCAQTTIDYVKQTGKPVWFDEYNVRIEKGHFDEPWHGTHRAASMQSLMNSGIQSSLMWTLIDQQWPDNHCTNQDAFVNGDHRYGVMPVLTRSLVPWPAYYSTGLVMKFMGGDPGTHIYEGIGTDFLHATVSKMPDGNISVLVINNKSKADDFTVDFGEKLGVKLNRRLYDPETIVPDERAKQIEADKTFEVDSVLSDSLPAGGVAVYTTISD